MRPGLEKGQNYCKHVYPKSGLPHSRCNLFPGSSRGGRASRARFAKGVVTAPRLTANHLWKMGRNAAPRVRETPQVMAKCATDPQDVDTNWRMVHVWCRRRSKNMRSLSSRLFVGFICISLLTLGAESHSKHLKGSTAEIYVGRNPIALAVDDRTSRAFVANEIDGTISVISIRSKSLLRTVRVSANPMYVAVDARTQHVFVLHSGNNSLFNGVSMLSTITGDLLRTVSINGRPRMIAIAESLGFAYIADGTSNTISILNTRNGTIVRKLTLGQSGGAVFAVAVDVRAARLFALEYPDAIALHGSRPLLVTFDVRTGIRVGTSAINGISIGDMTVDSQSGTVFIPSSASSTSQAGFVSMFNSTTGQLRRAITISNVGSLRVDTLTQRVFIFGNAARTGVISILDARSGAVQRVMTLGPWVRPGVVDQQTGAILALTGGGTTPALTGLQVLDGRTGTLLHTFPAGYDPTAVGIDSQTKRVVIVNRAGSMQPSSLLQWASPQGAGSVQQPLARGSVTILDTTP